LKSGISLHFDYGNFTALRNKYKEKIKDGLDLLIMPPCYATHMSPYEKTALMLKKDKRGLW